MSIGLIGNGNHSKKIQSILKKKKLSYFVYKPSKPYYFDETKLNHLKKCKIIFILSPNNTHYKYIKSLYKGRYIFCEKPPVNKKKELLELKKIKSKKIYFNYNFRFIKIANILLNREKYKLGKLIYANLSASHGLSQKKNYKNNWRSNIKTCPKGIFEMVSIHYIDLINHIFNGIKISRPILINSSKIGTSFDTSLVEIKLSNNALVNIFSTYNSAYSKNLIFLFKNGIVQQKNNILSIHGPSMNFTKSGFFKAPKLIKKFYVNQKKDLYNSLFDSVTFFLKHAQNKKNFKKKIWNNSIRSNSLIL